MLSPRQPIWRRSFNSIGIRNQKLAKFCMAASFSSGVLGAATKGLVAQIGLISAIGTGAVLVWGQSSGDSYTDKKFLTDDLPWVQDLAQETDVKEATLPGQMIADPFNKFAKRREDHLFCNLLESGHIKEFRCFYDQKDKKFISVVRIGKELCGYPNTVHGGLTAALIDETCGGLAYLTWRTGALGFRPPAYTARLEVDYKKKIPVNSVLKVEAKLEVIEGRKVWMATEVTNGEGQLYASGRVLFVSPAISKMFGGFFSRK